MLFLIIIKIRKNKHLLIFFSPFSFPLLSSSTSCSLYVARYYPKSDHASNNRTNEHSISIAKF